MSEDIHISKRPMNSPVKVMYNSIISLVRDYSGFELPRPVSSETMGPNFIELLFKHNEAVRKFEKENGIGENCNYPQYPDRKKYAFENDYIADCNKVSLEYIKSDRIYLKSWLEYNHNFKIKQSNKIKELKSKRFRLIVICIAMVLSSAIIAVATRYKIVTVGSEGFYTSKEIVKVDRWTGEAKRIYTAR